MYFKKLSITLLLQCFFTINHLMILILGSLLGYYLLPVEFKHFATLPAAVMLLFAFIFIPISRHILSKYGHQIGFFIGSFFGLCGAISFYYAVCDINFLYLLLATACFGVHQSYAGFLRYIAADNKPCCKKINMVATVITGSIIATMIVPILIQYTQNIDPIISYLGTAYAIIIINAIGIITSLFIQNKENHQITPQNKIAWQDLSRFKGFKTGASIALIANSMMHFLMLAIPFAIIGCGLAINDVSLTMQIHMIAMLLPAFIIGKLLHKFNFQTTLAIGIACFILTVPLLYWGYQTSNLVFFQIGMITMGFGWGILYIASTGLITLCYCPCDASGIQTKSEMIIVGGTGLLSLMSGIIYNFYGWQGILITVIILIIIASVIIIKDSKALIEQSKNGVVNQSHRASKFKTTITNDKALAW
ncbi:MAG: MFS family permease [Alphaproteobacteria bacterium]|jgi:MFS family permease